MNNMIHDKKELALPLVGLILVASLIALLLYPVVSASPKDLALAVLSLDKGAETPQGKMNIGEEMVENLVSVTNEDMPVVWTDIDSQSALDGAMENGEFYAAITIPSDFTAANVAAMMGQGEPASLKVQINQGKNPAIAQTIEMMLQQVLSANGASVTIEYVNPVSEDMGTGSTALQISYMLTILISIVCSILLFRALRVDKASGVKQRGVLVCIQVIYAAVLSLCIGWFVAFFLSSIAGLAVPFGELMLFAVIASFSLLLLILGFFAWHLAAGALALVTIIVCGLTTALLPYELLPEFWQNWLYPWVPERFVSEGLHQVLYLGSSAINDSSMVLLGIGSLGLALMLCSLAKGKKKAGDVQKAETPS